ncbi:hypothetical protein [Pleomorphomonas sp. PLEO]|uniref:hypothetical protein n=1 Tax=Pleomorphomonas sp. PLEO TaxID=3239306 RepID=UPI00351DB690
MTGSCERDACGSARSATDAAQLFAVHRLDTTESGLTRQGISSTDKDVTEGYPAAAMAGGFSSSSSFIGINSDVGTPLANDGRYPASAVSLVDGRYGQGLDSGVVSVKLPVGKQGVCVARRAGGACKFPVRFRSNWFAALSGRYRDGGRAITLGVKEVLPPIRHQPAWVEGVASVAIRRAQLGIRQKQSAL